MNIWGRSSDSERVPGTRLSGGLGSAGLRVRLDGLKVFSNLNHSLIFLTNHSVRTAPLPPTASSLSQADPTDTKTCPT